MAVLTSHLSRRAALQGAGMGALGLAGAALLGCGGGGDSENGSGGGSQYGVSVEGATKGAGLPLVAPKVEGAPKYGGLWRGAATSLPTQHDMHTALASTIWHYIGDKVIEIHPTSGETLPHVASSWEVQDPTTLIFKIRPGVKIHNRPPWNGREFVAEDVAWNMERLGGLYAEEEGIPIASFQRASMVANLQKAEAIDKHTVKVTLSKPNSAFFNGLTENRVPMMPPEMTDIGFKDPLKMAGTGPWQVEEWLSDHRRTFSKHPEYFRKGEPYFDSTETLIVPDAAATQAAFISGEIQYLSVPTPEEIAIVKKTKPEANLYTTLDSNWQHLRYGMRYQPFQDTRVRRAIFLAADYANMANGYYGDGWGYQGALLPGFPEAWKPDKVKGLPGYNPDTKVQDRQEALKLMEAAGYPLGRGLAYEIMVRSATGINMENATRFKEDMRVVFPEMEVKLNPKASSADFAVPQAESKFDMVSYTITAVPDAALELHSQYHTNGSRNYGQYSDKEMDSLIDNSLTELDKDKRANLLDGAQQRWYDEMPMMVLYTQPRKYMVQGNVGGFDKTWGIWFGYGSYTKIHHWYYVDK